jgi:hypothetical protein
LLDWINREGDDAGVHVAYSQLVALSRADFKHPLQPPAGGLSKQALEYYKTERTEAWERWWKSVGQHYDKRLSAKGRQNPAGWKLVARDAEPLPDYKITIPDEWTLRIAYRAGDYGGIQTETLTLHRSKEKATLVRALRRNTQADLEWERWEPLTTEQADNFAFAMAYAIDNPWLVKPNRDDKGLEGRTLTIYYPYFRYEFADLKGNIWWNDDLRYSPRGPDFVHANGLGSVCLLLWRTFPDASRSNAASRDAGKWQPIKMPDDMELSLIADDLILRGEIIDLLWHDQRIEDALETLTKVGTTSQLSAIAEFERELPRRVEKAKAVLKQDPNGKHLRSEVNRFLRDAANARVDIRARNN